MTKAPLGKHNPCPPRGWRQNPDKVTCSLAIAAAFALDATAANKAAAIEGEVLEAIARPAASRFETEFEGGRRNGEVPTLRQRGERQLHPSALYDLIAPCPYFVPCPHFVSDSSIAAF